MTQTTTPDIAELYGRLQTMTRRAEIAEKKAAQFEQLWKDQIAQRVEMMSQLVGRGLPLPAKVKIDNADSLRIESHLGQLRIIAPAGLVVFEDGAAAERVLVKLIEQAREAFPETFVEVF